MNKLFKLLSLNMRDYLNFYKILNAPSFSSKCQELFKFIFIILVYCIFGFFIYMFAKLLLETLITLKIEYVCLGIFFALSNIIILISSCFLIDGLFYNSKDYDILNSLPISKNIIITSKMLNLYFSNLLFTILIMVPVLIAYTSLVSVNISFYILYIITIFIIPLIPTIISIIIGSLITFISTRFQAKKLFQFIIMSISIVIYFYFSFKNSSLNEIQLAELGQSFLNMFNKIYPLTNNYLDLLLNHNLKSLLIFIILPIILYIITTVIISSIYKNIISKIGERKKHKNYTLKVTNNKQFISLFKKELKRLLSSPMYIFNSLYGLILLILGIVIILFMSPEKIATLTGFTEFVNLIKDKNALLIGLTLLLSCTTSSSISLEGKNLWIVKSIPVDPLKIFFSKINVNFWITFIPGVISIFIINYLFKLGIGNLLLNILIISNYAFLVSILGLIINLHFPYFDWKNEVRVIKQSLAVFLSLTCGLAIGLVFLLCNLKLELIIIILLFINIILFLYLKYVGVKLWSRL